MRCRQRPTCRPSSELEADPMTQDPANGTRALQLADSSVDSYFLETFGRPDRLITCECERTDEPSMTQVLHLYNGETLNKKLESPDSRVAKSLAARNRTRRSWRSCIWPPCAGCRPIRSDRKFSPC